MKIHTSLTYDEMQALVKKSGAPIGYEALDEHRSRTHDRAFSVRLTGTGGRSNTGLYGAGDYSGATWDEWGAFFGALFDRDSEARCGGTEANPVYRDARHFHYLTDHRFKARGESADGDKWNYLPADTHPRHRWVYQGYWGDHGTSNTECSKCGANRPPFIAGKDWS